MIKKVPEFESDQEAAAFVDQDLAELDFGQFRPVSFEFASKDVQLNMRLPQGLLDAVKLRARQRGLPYTRYIRELIERDVGPAKSSSR